MRTRDYGDNGKDVNGFEMPELPVIGRNEPWGHMAGSAATFDSKDKMQEAAWMYWDQTGKVPSVVFSPNKCGTLKGFSMRFGTTNKFLNVEYGAKEYAAA